MLGERFWAGIGYMLASAEGKGSWYANRARYMAKFGKEVRWMF